MLEFIKKYLRDNGILEQQGLIDVASLILVFIILVFSFVSYNISRKLMCRLALFVSKKDSKYEWLSLFVDKKVFDNIAHFVPITIFNTLEPIFPRKIIEIHTFIAIYFCIVAARVVAKVLDALATVYIHNHQGKSNVRPINSYIDMLKIIVYSTSGLCIIALLFDQSLWTILSGIGALTAVFIVVFRDSLLGLVASIQISNYNLVQISDWIEIPKYNVEGVVEDINLNTMRIRNFDNSLSIIPTHMVISESFRNWRGMEESGGRRIKRHILVDVESIKNITNNDWDSILKNSPLFTNLDRRITNVGTLQAYLERFLNAHPHISKDFRIMVRQLQPNDFGLPIEFYCFSVKKDLLPFEHLQSEIMEEIFTALPMLGLRMYQRPSVFGQRLFAMDESKIYQ